VELTEGGEEAVAARNTSRGCDNSTIGADEVEGRGGMLVVRFEGRMGEGGERVATASGGAF
jgi:hypothetical protein